MKLITRQVMANEAAYRWHNQYYNEYLGTWTVCSNFCPKDIYRRLVALGKNPNPDDVTKIIGNDSWIEPGRCDECNNTSETLLQVGEQPDYDSRTACLCLDCIDLLSKIRLDCLNGQADGRS